MTTPLALGWNLSGMIFPIATVGDASVNMHYCYSHHCAAMSRIKKGRSVRPLHSPVSANYSRKLILLRSERINDKALEEFIQPYAEEFGEMLAPLRRKGSGVKSSSALPPAPAADTEGTGGNGGDEAVTL